MKGFNLLAIATSVVAGVITWHIFINSSTEGRVSYIDKRLDDLEEPKGLSLRSLETSRHIIGWCPEAKDMCGKREPFLLHPPSFPLGWLC